MAPTPDPLLLLLQQFVLESERYVEAVSDHSKLHRTDLNALAAMVRAAAEGRTVTPGELRRELNLSSPATTALIDRLDRTGHVNRLRSESDRRKVFLQLTDKARRDGGAMFAPLARHISQALENYPEAERQLMAGFLAEVTAATAAACAEVAGGAPASADAPDGPGRDQ